MLNRFQKARNNLMDLLKYYGDRPILVRLTQEGEEVRVSAKYFFKRRLSKTGMPFIFGTGSNKIAKLVNPQLDDNKLSVILFKAIFEFESAYIEVFCEGKPQAKDYINYVNEWIKQKQEWLSSTFPIYKEEDLIPFINPKISLGYFSEGLEVTDKDVKTLEEMGYKRISDEQDMTELFWDFAVRREPIGNLMKNAILAITLDEQAANYLITNHHKLNRIIQEKIDDNGLSPEEKKNLKEMDGEILKIRQEANKKVKAARKNVQEQLKNIKGIRKVSRKLKQLLLNPLSPITQSYDLTQEEDIDNYIAWFRAWGRRIPPTFVRQLEKRSYQESGMLVLFKQKVEEHNIKYTIDASDDDNDDSPVEDDILS